MLALFMPMCINVDRVHVLGRSRLPQVMSMYWGRFHVGAVHVQVIMWGGQCCLCSCSCVRTITVTSVHVNVYVLGGGS